MRGGGGDGGAAQARADEQARQEKIRQGTQKINTIFDGSDGQPGQFNDTFYAGRKQAYLDYATPQLNDQYQKAQRDLVFALDRSGNLNSSARAEQEANLMKLYDTNRRAIADQGLTYESQARSNVEDARANLISMLNATGDVEGATNSAIARSKQLTAADSYSPLGDMFGAFTNALGAQAAAERAYSLGTSGKPLVNTGLFGTKKNSVAVTGD